MTNKEFDELLSRAAMGFEDEEEFQEYHRHDAVMEALRLAYNKGVTDSAESAKTIGHSCGDPMTCGCQGNCEHLFYTVSKQSILKLLIKP